jgi:hypothetical protein
MRVIVQKEEYLTLRLMCSAVALTARGAAFGNQYLELRGWS